MFVVPLYAGPGIQLHWINVLVYSVVYCNRPVKAIAEVTNVIHCPDSSNCHVACSLLTIMKFGLD